jgi:small subunit ribosomal protein S23
MGRYNLKPSRVYQTAVRLRSVKGEDFVTPTWFKVIAEIPPAEILTRDQPVQHRNVALRKGMKKPSKMFKPQNITFEEDALRDNFYHDHPWELARPRVILEQDGKDGLRCDWSRIQQAGRPLNGER